MSEHDQFLDVLEKHKGLLVKVAHVYAHTMHDREDLVNDIIFALWTSFKRFRGDSNITTWIYKVALNTALNYKRKLKASLNIKSWDEPGISESVLYMDDHDSVNQIEVLYRCIDELDEINKAIILLYLDGLSHEAIADIMGLTRTNVGTRIGRIKEELKKISNQNF
jgi:RNA polymerase sigma factor (sigma-70 family)